MKNIFYIINNMGDLYDDYMNDGNGNDLEEIIEQRIECEEDGGEQDGGDHQQNDEDEENGPGKRVEPKHKRVIKNPRPKLNEERLKGPRGLLALEECFKNIKFRGKGNEKDDLDTILKTLEHWQYRLYPSLNFDDFLEKVEKLGHKQIIKTFVKKVRMDLITPDNNPISNEYINEENDILFNSTETTIPTRAVVLDPFEQLLNQNNYVPDQFESSFVKQQKILTNTETQEEPPLALTQEQMDLMETNRRRAQQKRLERINKVQQQNSAEENLL